MGYAQYTDPVCDLVFYQEYVEHMYLPVNKSPGAVNRTENSQDGLWVVAAPTQLFKQLHCIIFILSNLNIMMILDKLWKNRIYTHSYKYCV